MSSEFTRFPKVLVVCLDGSLNKFSDSGITNIVRIASLLDKSQPHKQRVYYQSGVGTYDFNAKLSRATSVGLDSRLMSLASATDFDDHVLDAYRWLMESYEEGDLIYVFGFSRGAYAAGCLCGMLETVGLMHRYNNQLLAAAWEVYKLPDTDVRHQKAQYFRTTFSQLVQVHFLGLWDTVGYIKGKRDPYLFPLHKGSVRYVYHAMSLDERRGRFEVKRYLAPKKPVLANISDFSQSILQTGFINTETIIHEAWFPGNHVDLGGGNSDNDNLLKTEFPYPVQDNDEIDFNVETHVPQLSLSLVPFRWILRAAITSSYPLWNEKQPWYERSAPTLLLDGIATPRYSDVLSYAGTPCPRGPPQSTQIASNETKLEAGGPGAVSLGALVKPDAEWYAQVKEVLKRDSSEDWFAAREEQKLRGADLTSGQQPSWDSKVNAPFVESFIERLPTHDALKWTDAGGVKRSWFGIALVCVYRVLELWDLHFMRGRLVDKDDIIHASALTRRRVSEITSSDGRTPVYIPAAQLPEGQSWEGRFDLPDDDAKWAH